MLFYPPTCLHFVISYSNEILSTVIPDKEANIKKHQQNEAWFIWNSLLACFSGLFHTPPNTSQKYYQSWIETTSIFFSSPFLKRSFLAAANNRKKLKQNNDKSDFCVLCRKSDDETKNIQKQSSGRTHTRAFHPITFFTCTMFSFATDFSIASSSALGWNFMHLVFDLRRIDGFAFGTLLLSQA